jgi:flagellar assembly factor FliW
VKIQTGRFGELKVGDEVIYFPEGILGFSEHRRFCVVDPSDDTLILWLQSLDDPHLAFPIIEPKIFDPKYIVRLSAAERRDLKLESLRGAAVFSILTIPQDVTLMTANLKAPIVVNLASRSAKQVVLQENNLNLKHPMFRELRSHLMTIRASITGPRSVNGPSVVPVAEVPPTGCLAGLS